MDRDWDIPKITYENSKPFSEGYEAYTAQGGTGAYPNNGIAKNPYGDEFSWQHWKWIAGWNDRWLEKHLERTEPTMN